MQEAAVRRNQWDLEVDMDTEITDITKPEFWCHVASKLRKWDRVEVRHCAGLWMAEVLVRSVGSPPVWAHVALLRKLEFPDAKIPPEIERTPFSVGFIRGQGWRVTRKADARVIQSGFNTAAEAAAYVTTVLVGNAA